MGVKYLWSWLRNTFPECFKDVKACPPFQEVYIDCNNLIHQAAQRTYGYGDQGSCLTVMKKKPTAATTAAVVKQLIKKILRKMHTPIKTVYIAVDGVAPNAKQNQQRGRRMISTYVDCTGFDPNCITSGSVWMNALCAELKTPGNGAEWINPGKGQELAMATIFSGTDEPGEGEHKCMTALRALSSDAPKCIIGIDTDLIVMGLMSAVRRLYVTSDDLVIDIDLLRSRIENLYSISIETFCRVVFFCGNDFLPSAFKIKTGGLDHLLSLVSSPSETNTALTQRLDIVSMDENLMMKGGGNAHDYFKTMEWIYRYYTDNTPPSWDWAYCHVNPPSKQDMIEYVPVSYHFEKGQPTTQLQQLLRVLPSRSKHLVPKEYRHILEAQPQDYEIVGSGWDAVVVTTIINESK